MKTKLFDAKGNEKEDVELPKVFGTRILPDVIQRAFLSIMSKLRQPYGPSYFAGNRSSAHYHGARHYRYTMMNKETARLTRIHGLVGYMTMTARNAPQARKGRKSHAPSIEKNWTELINKKEKKLAVRSALAASANIDIVKSKGHRTDVSPMIFENDFENILKTKEVFNSLENSGLSKELERCGKRKVRAGKGKMRGRKYKTKKGPVIITSKQCNLLKSARNIQGVDVVIAKDVNALLLAPGAMAGRLTIITEDALKELDKRFGK